MVDRAEDSDLEYTAIKDVRVKDIMGSAKDRKPATVLEDTPLKEVIDAMIANMETRKVYVVDADGKLKGTITLETLLRRAGYVIGIRKTGITSFLKMLGEIADDKAVKAMTESVRIREDEMLVNVVRLMIENHLNDLPIVDDTGHLVGELNGLDILRGSRKYLG